MAHLEVFGQLLWTQGVLMGFSVNLRLTHDHPKGASGGLGTFMGLEGEF